jgi:hypothetical protein
MWLYAVVHVLLGCSRIPESGLGIAIRAIVGVYRDVAALEPLGMAVSKAAVHTLVVAIDGAVASAVVGTVGWDIPQSGGTLVAQEEAFGYIVELGQCNAATL